MASQKQIIKRDGRVETFNKQKVINAVKKAFVAVDGTLTKAGVKKARRIGKEIETIILNSKTTLGVEEIQDLVENLLIYPRKKTDNAPKICTKKRVWGKAVQNNQMRRYNFVQHSILQNDAIFATM